MVMCSHDWKIGDQSKICDENLLQTNHALSGMTYVKFPPSSVRTSFQNGCSALSNSLLRDFRRFYRTKPKTFKPALEDAFPDIPKNPPPSEWKRKGNSGFFAKYSNIADYDLASTIYALNLGWYIEKCVAGLAPKVYKNTTVIDVNPGIVRWLWADKKVPVYFQELYSNK